MICIVACVQALITIVGRMQFDTCKVGDKCEVNGMEQCFSVLCSLNMYIHIYIYIFGCFQK